MSVTFSAFSSAIARSGPSFRILYASATTFPSAFTIWTMWFGPRFAVPRYSYFPGMNVLSAANAAADGFGLRQRSKMPQPAKK